MHVEVVTAFPWLPFHSENSNPPGSQQSPAWLALIPSLSSSSPFPFTQQQPHWPLPGSPSTPQVVPAPGPLHLLFFSGAFNPLSLFHFSSWSCPQSNICYIFLLYLFHLLSPPLDCKLYASRDFCLFCSLLWSQHLREHMLHSIVVAQ